MQNKIKLGAASLTLAALMAGCAPMAGTQPQGSTNIPAAGSYTTPTTNYNTTPNYDYNNGSNSSNTTTSYYDYGSGTGSNTSSSGYDNYYAGSNTSSNSSSGSSTYYDYNASSSGGSYDTYSGGTSNGNVSGSHAVQVVASPNRSTAEAMLSQMQSMGFTATIDQVGGYYKVRIPYGSESEAKSNLSRIRATVPDAFYTAR